ncbi:DinB family protein [Alteribacillus sp. HJP-4]|uniref:DinB family protein n=1 Tax=Alteribacillus sp. HJP-4 TaxID=2775394 RepID=UPI0035CCDAD6
MQKLFQYNWQVRNDWFAWCENVPEEELLKKRTGGAGSILYTLFHIIDVEYSWLQDLQGKQAPEEPPFHNYNSLERVRELSNIYHQEVEPFVSSWTDEMESLIHLDTNAEGRTIRLRHGEVMRHVIAHEIHHVGQLSIWAREMNRKPITANLIERGLFDEYE